MIQSVGIPKTIHVISCGYVLIVTKQSLFYVCNCACGSISELSADDSDHDLYNNYICRIKTLSFVVCKINAKNTL